MSTESLPISLITSIKDLDESDSNYIERERSVIELINSKKFIYDEVDEKGNTPLMYACQYRLENNKI